jgi:hypothetical protein
MSTRYFSFWAAMHLKKCCIPGNRIPRRELTVCCNGRDHSGSANITIISFGANRNSIESSNISSGIQRRQAYESGTGPEAQSNGKKKIAESVRSASVPLAILTLSERSRHIRSAQCKQDAFNYARFANSLRASKINRHDKNPMRAARQRADSAE